MAVTIRRDEVSWGALALILCLALPMGILSRLAPGTTADEVDAAESVLVARLTAMQTVRASGVTLLQFDLDHVVVGTNPGRRFQLPVEGRPALEVGDLVLTMLSFDTPSLHGAYQVRKDQRSLDYMVHTRVTGMAAEGLYDLPPVSLEHVEDAIRRRRGLGGRDPRSAAGSRSSGVPDDDEGSSGSSRGEGSSRQSGGSRKSGKVPDEIAAGGDDHGNTIGEATPVQVKLPHLMTGMPSLVTGFLVPGDVDYFSFDAPVLSLLHAHTQMPDGLTSIPPDTIMGLFDATTGELLAHDDDSGQGTFSSFVVPIEATGPYVVAVEGAPDPDLTFTGADGVQTGPYVLSLELEQAAYLANFLDLIVGVSPDGTFIEDFVGFKRVDGPDVLLNGVAADGWGLEYDARLPTGLSHVYGGSGDFIVEPGFNAPVDRSIFSIGYLGDNRRGQSHSQTTLPYQSHPNRSVKVAQGYNIQLSQSTLGGTLRITVNTQDRIEDIVYRRLMDVDLFGVGDDTFYWSFGQSDEWMVYPAELTASLETLEAPPASSGQVTGDRQVALVAGLGTISGASFQNPITVRVPVAFTLVDQFVNELDAVQSAVQNLLATDADAWTVAVDADPSTGLYMAFGVGLGEPVR